MPQAVPEALEAALEQRFALSTSLPARFFEREAPRIAEACWAMARRFHQGGRLLAFGNGAWATDAQHVSVEFVHPVIVGKRALPALALTNDSATLSGLMAGGRPEMPFGEQLRVLARPQDIALGFSPDGRCVNVLAALAQARQLGLLTLAMLGGDGGLLSEEAVDYRFVVPADDPFIVQEVHETLYHVLWELVHVFFEHEGLLQ
ncbi:D-sedoheptulose-7-phosphate isomerase [Thermogemmatispora tikiterensis]|uniref:Phosphoheptose isomerase n=1 Tax=Thermogemmatispora tikiterensis TaxID=1825093 RepID=A0A328VHP7_9CHLR|nr:SIS domain-containing protein [Thermogemmatispora tikiterensis]RAQ96411.1 phosphoheptose isomerase [Thermogemmatispora tikiterensis]